MALVLKDRVRESSTSSGTGSITLGGAFTGYQTFASAVASGSTVYYTIHNTTAGNEAEWEVGVGTFTSPSTLSRDTVLSSSAGAPTKTNFSGSSILEVFITQPAEEAVYINQATGKVEAFGNGTNSISFVNVTADLFTGNASAISAINASNISSGTIDNARTTAASANGASTIVARGTSGEFSAGAITSTSISGNGVALTAINASNITSGTLDNARTTASDANGASTIVARDASGNFTANAGTFTSVSGNGVALTAINASNISSGTIDNARTTASSSNGASTIVLRDANGAFSAGVITGDGSALSSINATNLSAGTVASARISGSYTGITGVGTLTAGTWNANAVGAQYGGTGSANLTAENVILGNGASAVKVVAPGTANNVLTSNGTTWISQAPAASGGFDVGTVMLFGQTSAPTGWTKDSTNYNNSGLRVVTGTASTGGSVDFTTAFASQTPSGSVSISAISGSAGATTLSTPQIPSHAHGVVSYSGGDNLSNQPGTGNDFSPRTGTTNNEGGGGSHTHPFSFSSGSASFSGNAINLAVKYVDVIRATKN